MSDYSQENTQPAPASNDDATNAAVANVAAVASLAATPADTRAPNSGTPDAVATPADNTGERPPATENDAPRNDPPYRDPSYQNPPRNNPSPRRDSPYRDSPYRNSSRRDAPRYDSPRRDSYREPPRYPQQQPKPQTEIITVEGIFEPDKKENGVLVATKRGGRPRPTDPFVARDIAKRYRLKRGSYIVGKAIHDPRLSSTKLRDVETVDGLPPEARARCLAFTQLTSVAPDKQLHLETKDGRLTNRVIDLFCPVGKGTRGVIVAPPRTGKTTLLKDIAQGVFENHPECKVMVLLVDERPEEVTDFRRELPLAELYASSNDEDVHSHIAVAESCAERARRLVEAGAEVVLLIDSLTRLTRAYNNAKTGSGKTMSGGIDSRALEKPRQIFSSARNTEEGGSLTIVASALVQTGSRMDDLIFEEFKGTGNMEMVLDRKVAELRIWPAFNLAASGTRKEELILAPEALEAASFLRRAMSGAGKIEDIAESMTERLAKTKTNAEFVKMILNK
ncbi:MAG: transcription termination factor Rho [Puniceicoccales bacterium]|nr:transcription termination factor Rho [Puniceicoccales bacterium]